MTGAGIIGGLGIEWVSILILVGIIGLMLMGLPLAFVTGSIALALAIFYIGPQAAPLVASRIYTLANDYVLVAVPMFVLMASILDQSGVAKDLYDSLQAWAGGIRGGVAVMTLLAALTMAAMSGIIGGEVVLLGMIALPQMVRIGYNQRLSIGTVCAGGSLGTMMPPSIVLIVYGLTANESIGALFVAAVFPAVLLCSLYVGYILVRVHLNHDLAPAIDDPEFALPMREKLKLLKGLVAPVVLILCVLGTIYAGIASITEAASMGAVGAMIAAAARKEMSIRMMQNAVTQTLITCGTIIWIGLAANALVGIYNLMGGNRFVDSVIMGLGLPPLGIIVLMMAVLIVLGMFMDWIGIVFLTMPIFVPIVAKLGYDPIWFGVVFCMNMQISFLSPPFGPAAFYLKGVVPPEITLGEIFISLLPFIALQVVALSLVILFPDIAMWLPTQLSVF